MDASSQALRRWAPLMAVIGVQVLLVAVVPSRGSTPAGAGDALLQGAAPFSSSAPRKGGVQSKRVAASFTPSRAASIRSMRRAIGRAAGYGKRKTPHLA